MRIILTGGVTGGHIYPALAIGDKFKEMIPDCEIIFVGSGYGLEADIVPRHGYKLYTVTSRSFDRSNPIKIANTLAGIQKGKMQAYKIMKNFKPDVVVSTGSFVSVPVVLAAKKYGAKIFIHEQNAFPGLANKSMLSKADALFLGFRTAAHYFSDQGKLVYVGNPVRSEFYNSDRTASRDKLGIAQGDMSIFVFGGSLGADALNDVGFELSKAYGGKAGIHITFGTGKRFYDEVKDRIEQSVSDLSNIDVKPYIQDMPDVLAASDIVISRSGALSVAEITASGRAAIFIPSPNVTGDHQYYNAKEVADNGGGIIVHEDDDTSRMVINIVGELLADPEMIRDMEKGSKASAPSDSAGLIFDSIMKACGGSDV